MHFLFSRSLSLSILSWHTSKDRVLFILSSRFFHSFYLSLSLFPMSFSYILHFNPSFVGQKKTKSQSSSFTDKNSMNQLPDNKQILPYQHHSNDDRADESVAQLSADSGRYLQQTKRKDCES